MRTGIDGCGAKRRLQRGRGNGLRAAGGLLAGLLVTAAGLWILSGLSVAAADERVTRGEERRQESESELPLGDAVPFEPAPPLEPAPGALGPAPLGTQPAAPVNPGDIPVTLSAFDTDVRDVLNELSLQSGVNILATPDVRGTVTLELADVPLEEAIRTVLAPFGYVYRWSGSYYLVGVPDSRSLVFPDLTESAVIPIRYGEAARIAGLLSDSLAPYVKADPTGNRLMVTAPAGILQRIREDVAKLDVPPAEIQVRVVVTELSRRGSQELGLDSTSFNASAQAPLGINVSPSGLGLTYQQLVTNLRALESRQEAQVRADPDVRVTEGRTLTLFVGRRQFFVLPNQQGTSRLEQVESGVRLNLTARSLGGGELSLTVSPSVSQVLPGEREGIPSVQSSELSTTIRLQSGQTAVLATMTVDNALTGEQESPGFTDLPLIGWLFRTENRQESQRRLVVFVTPEILPGLATAALR